MPSLGFGFREIRHQIEYKALLYGAGVIAVDPAYTSQTCNRCGHVDAKNRRTRDQCTCTRCGHATHASIGVSKERPSPRAGEQSTYGTFAALAKGPSSRGQQVGFWQADRVSGNAEASGDRFRDRRERKYGYDFLDEVLVHCPRCDGCATVTPRPAIPADKTAVGYGILDLQRRLRCTGCGFFKDRKVDSAVVGSPVDPYFQQPV